jgi:3-hydroxy-3-methylglutaryl CoA synthase
MTTRSGIDDLNIYASTMAVDFSAIAAARGLSDKPLRQAHFERRSVLPPFEDPVTLAVNAARPLVEAGGTEPFALLIVATETGLDFGKPISSYVHRYLGLNPACRNFEIKHACYGGTAALQMAIGWVRSCADLGQRHKALVIMTDIARRQFDTPAELTAGAGAVALSVAMEPRVLAVDPPSGCAAREVYDVARPTATLEWDDPVLSLSAYLDLFEAATHSYRQATGIRSLERHFDALVYHTPLMSLVEEAHRLLLETERDVCTANEVDASFRRLVGASMGYSRELANVYTGNLYAGLASLLDADPALRDGARVGLFSYGSGACGEFFGGTLGPEACAVVGAHAIGKNLASRLRIGVPEYHAGVLAVEQSLVAAEFDPWEHELVCVYDKLYRGKDLLVLDGVRNHYRSYAWS